MKIEWLPLARQDRGEQLAYIAERNPWAAIDLGDALDAAISHLSNYPQSGRPGRVTGTRELVVGGRHTSLPIALNRMALSFCVCFMVLKPAQLLSEFSDVRAR